jgi:hypothetical protein
MSDGQAPITAVSFIVTVNEHEELPQVLDAVHVTVVVPVGKEKPDAGEHTTLAAGNPEAVGSIHVAM